MIGEVPLEPEVRTLTPQSWAVGARRPNKKVKRCVVGTQR